MSLNTEKNWTPSQRRAIEHEGKDLLLSAAAGSGKTATLTARLIRLLCSPEGDALPSEVLAVTFTNAASAEMKTRLYEAAEKETARNPHNAKARRLLAQIDSVQICTMHSFCLSAIRPYFAELGLPSDFRVADETESEILRHDAMCETVTEFFDSGLTDGEFVTLCDVLSSARDEASLEKTLLALASSLDAKGLGSKELYTYAENIRKISAENIFTESISESARDSITSFAEHYGKFFDSIEPFLSENENIAKAYLPECIRLRDFCILLAGAVKRGDYSLTRELVCGFSFGRLSPVKPQNQTDESLKFKKYRDKFKSGFFAYKNSYFNYTDAEIEEAASKTAAVELSLAKVMEAFEARFTKKKRERGVVDFSDIEKLTKQLLIGEDGKPTAQAENIASRYRYIFIDEFQDTNEVQNGIFRAVSLNSTLFTVGDIKQSIYSFRGAQPEVFARMRRLYEEHPDEGDYIFMSENFRSSENVLAFANAVSDRMFPFSSVPYDSGDRLRFARGGDRNGAPCELVLIPTDAEDEAESDDEWESREELISEPDYIAQRIRRIIAHERKPDGTPVTPGDCAILLRSANTKADDYAAALAKVGIRSDKSAKSDVFANGVILSVLCILNAVANPELDIYLAGAMKTPVFGFTLEETVKLRLDYPDMPLISSVTACAEKEGELSRKCAAFAEKLRELRDYASVLTADGFIRTVSRHLELETALASENADFTEVRAGIRTLRNIAKDAEKSGYTSLNEFLHFTERMMERKTFVASSPEPDRNAVSIMSIHQSKGLEFPVCFIAGSASKFKLKDAAENLLLDPSAGIACRLPDDSGLVRCDNILRRCASASIQRSAVEEEMRVLYVAMTRAREKLIVTASVKSPEQTVRAAREALPYDSKHEVLSAKHYLSWLLPPLAAGDWPYAAITVPDAQAESKTGIPDGIIKPAPQPAEKGSDARDTNRLASVLKKRFDFAYPYEYQEKIPAKLTVSRLYPSILDEEAEAELADTADFEKEAPMPEFMKKDRRPSPAEIGTATHVFMQFCNFERLEAQGAQAELDRLVSERFISDRAARLVELDKIGAFCKSELFGRIRSAKRLFREFRFNSSRPASRFTADPDLARKLEENGADVIVQGVVDLLFEDKDGRLVLADYKTDRFTAAQKADPKVCDEILRERHSMQLAYYREICGEMMGRAIDECFVYSTELARCVEISEFPQYTAER